MEELFAVIIPRNAPREPGLVCFVVNEAGLTIVCVSFESAGGFIYFAHTFDMVVCGQQRRIESLRDISGLGGINVRRR